MGATSTQGVGHGDAGDKVSPIGNVSNVLFASSAYDGETLESNIDTVFLDFDDDYTLNLPAPETKTGRRIYFRSRNTNGNTVTLIPVYGSDYGFNDGYMHMEVISDGKEWSISHWYTDD